MDNIGALLASFATLTGFVWAATEFLPRAIKPLNRVGRELLAILLGPLTALAAAAAGLLDLGYGAAALMGVISTVLAGVAHDYLAKPMMPGKL
jgi:hypothetical protein